MTDRECCIACNCISGVGYSIFTALTNEFGSPANIPGQSRCDYIRAKGVGIKLAEALENTDFELAAAKEINRAAAANVKIITIYDSEYPESLKELSSPPIALYVAGKLPADLSRSIAIVGSRSISKYANEQTRRIAADAAANGFVVVSGMAAGADYCAHRACLDAGGTTIGIIGAGLENIYPAAHRDMANEIIRSGGALISELPMQFPVTSTGFPRRNRIIAGLARGVLVTEAGLKSGSMITADFAQKYNRMLFALPGRVDNPNVAGCHHLIKNGAMLIEKFSDIAKKYDISSITESYSITGNSSVMPELSPECKILYDAIKQGTDSFDMLVIKTGLPVAEVSAGLMFMELDRIITREADSTYRLLT